MPKAYFFLTHPQVSWSVCSTFGSWLSNTTWLLRPRDVVSSGLTRPRLLSTVPLWPLSLVSVCICYDASAKRQEKPRNVPLVADPFVFCLDRLLPSFPPYPLGGNTGLGYETAKALVEAGYLTVIGKNKQNDPR